MIDFVTLASSSRRVGGGAAIACAWLLLCAAAPPEEPSATEVAAGLQSWLDGTRDLEARFEQTLVSGALGSGAVETGRLIVDRPGRMRWDYLEPERKIALVEGDSTRLYLEEDRQLWRGRLSDADGYLPELFASDRRLAELFRPELAGGPREGRGAAYRLRLVPRQASESFEQVELTLRPPDFAIEAVELLDAAGNRVRYRFRDLRRNRGVPASAFVFEPPSGTEIMAAP
jgi:outer membrane lipoprotein carrier protein